MNEIQTTASDITMFKRNLFPGLRRNFLFRNISTITKMCRKNAKDESTIKRFG